MNELLAAFGAFIPVKWVALGIALIPIIGRSYDALRNGGGIRGLWRAIYLGRSVNTPDAVAKDVPAPPTEAPKA